MWVYFYSIENKSKLFYFKPTGEMTNGLFNVEAYPKFALFCGVLMAIAIIISS